MEEQQKTVLHDRHLALGARMTPFCCYDMPVQYADGVLAEHRWTREQAGLFDVSHMGPARLVLARPRGDADADHAAISALIEPLICGDIQHLKPGQVRYTLLLNRDGGALDDLMVARPFESDAQGSLYIVVNAGTKQADFARIAAAAAGGAARLERLDGGGLMAVQGPAAAAVTESLIPGATDLGFMTHRLFHVQGHDLIVSRSGYTGEDGFEIWAPAIFAAPLWDQFLADARVRPVGLGARDSLRLEAGLPLYGHDLDETVSPVEAGLSFALSKRRREQADFPGAARILKELNTGPKRIRAGLRISKGAPAREGAVLVDQTGQEVGVVTSGGPSPSLGGAIALAFVRPDLARPGQSLFIKVRERLSEAEVVALPFFPHRYFRKA